MKNNGFLLSEGVKQKENFLVDFPLKRKIEVDFPANANDLEKLNDLYFVNVSMLGRSIVRNVPYRIDVPGRSFVSIIATLLYSLLCRGCIQLLFVLSIFGALTGNFWVIFLALFVCDIVIPFCFHEALHLYLFRKFANCIAGTVVIKGSHFFVLFPQGIISLAHRLIVAGVPSMLTALIGLMMLIFANAFSFPVLMIWLMNIFALPWVLQILSLLPGTTDFMGVVEAAKLLAKQRK